MEETTNGVRKCVETFIEAARAKGYAAKEMTLEELTIECADQIADLLYAKLHRAWVEKSDQLHRLTERLMSVAPPEWTELVAAERRRRVQLEGWMMGKKVMFRPGASEPIRGTCRQWADWAEIEVEPHRSAIVMKHGVFIVEAALPPVERVP